MYLLQINKEKKHQKKSDFFREVNINRTSEINWKRGSLPANTTLNRITDYFNKWLNLNLTPEDILTKDIEKIIRGPKVAVPLQTYISDEDKELLDYFTKLKPEDRQLILTLVKKLSR